MEDAFFMKNFLSSFFSPNFLFSFLQCKLYKGEKHSPRRPCPRSFQYADFIRGQAEHRNTAHTTWKKEVIACMKKRAAVLLAVLFLVGYGVMHMMPFWFGNHLDKHHYDEPFAEHHHFAFYQGGEPFAEHHHFVFYQEPMGMMMLPHIWMMFGILAFLFHLLLLAIGWIWWRTARPSKWLGLALMVWGLIGLLPKWALILLVFAAAYLLEKRQQHHTISIESWSTPSSQAAHILDEWEKSIKKEDS
jgi:uncharacterized membrane protein